MTAFNALLIGNANFPQDPSLDKLNGPLNDVDALREELTNEATGIFTCDPPLKDATAQEVMDAAGDFFDTAHRSDTLLFYYSGHGRTDLSNELYLCAHDTDTRRAGSPRIDGTRLSKLMRQSPAQLQIIVLDCCYANRFKGAVWSPRYFLGQGRLVLAATTRGSPLVPDADAATGLSPFTELFIEALRQDNLDRDGDGMITAHEVAEYISTRNQTQPNMPYVLEKWTGTGIVPIARSGERRGEPPVEPVAHAPSHHVPSWPELVALPDGFWLSRTQVTNAQFRAFLSDPANAAWRPRTDAVHRDYLRNWRDGDFPPDIANHPVVNVTLEAAVAYADWAGRRMGCPLRLPTESEWLAAAQAGRTGNWYATDVRAGLVNYSGTLAELTDVGEFQANAQGICDLLGQVWEICLYGTGEPVLLGGAYNTPLPRLNEHWTPPDQCRSDVGFRCASDRGTQ